jgi:hypothetical protein
MHRILPLTPLRSHPTTPLNRSYAPKQPPAEKFSIVEGGTAEVVSSETIADAITQPV